jgi:hypothetical protein
MHNLNHGKSSPKNVGKLIKKTEQSKQSANGRKFAQSGHPGPDWHPRLFSGLTAQMWTNPEVFLSTTDSQSSER